MKVRGRGIINILTSIPYATPGTVLAFAFILSFGRGIFFVQHTSINWDCLSLKVFKLCFENDNGWNESSRFCFRRGDQGFRSKLVDDHEDNLVSSTDSRLNGELVFVFMPAFSELTMSVLLTGPGLETLGTLLFQLQEYGDASGGGSSVLALMIIVFILVMNTSVKKLSKGKYGL